MVHDAEKEMKSRKENQDFSDAMRRSEESVKQHKRMLDAGKPEKETGCFPAGTLILTPNGKSPIESLSTGDVVLSPKLNGTLEPRRILKRLVHRSQKTWTISLANGKLIQTTSIHSFLRNGKWIQAKYLKPGEKITMVDGQGGLKEQEIACAFKDNISVPVYNLIIASNFTYIASESVVHSFTYFRQFRMLYWRHIACLFHRCKNKKVFKKVPSAQATV